MAWYDFLGAPARAIPGVGNMVESFLHPERGYQEAEKEARRAWEESQGYQRPFWEEGLKQRELLGGAERSLLDPESLLAKWMGGYQESPYAKYMQGKTRESGLGSASSMGLLGSSAALENLQQSAHDISEQDRQRYLQDLMQKYMTGIGLGQNIYGTGANIGANLGRGAYETGLDVGGLRGAAARAPGALLGQILKSAGDIGINYATGGLSGGRIPMPGGSYAT